MLTETAFQNSFSHLFGRAVREGLPVGADALSGSIEWMGAPMLFSRNTEIYGEEEPADCLYQVISGAVRTYKVLIDGRRQIGAFHLSGDIFGLEAGERHAFSAEAVTDAKVLVISRSLVLSRAALDHRVARELWALMGRELQRAQDRILLLIKRAPERVAGFLLEMAERIQSSDEVELPMSRQDVADYLGVTIETVSRMLTRFEKASAIALPTSKRIVLRDHAVLKRLTLEPLLSTPLGQHPVQDRRRRGGGGRIEELKGPRYGPMEGGKHGYQTRRIAALGERLHGEACAG